MSKYYTPEIEEFHVNFEFEQYIIFDNKPMWVKTIMTKNTNDILKGKEPIEVISNDRLDLTKSRVKYLDREDIESLGFELDIFSSFDLFKKGDYNLMTTMELNSYQHIYIFQELSVFPNKNILFKGYIKNKSELKKLLNQLGI